VEVTVLLSPTSGPEAVGVGTPVVGISVVGIGTSLETGIEVGIGAEVATGAVEEGLGSVGRLLEELLPPPMGKHQSCV